MGCYFSIVGDVSFCFANLFNSSNNFLQNKQDIPVKTLPNYMWNGFQCYIGTTVC